MASDRVAQFVIGLGGDSSDLDKVFAGVKSSVERTVSDLQKATDRLDLFKSISDNLPSVQRALDSAKAKIDEYTAAIAKAQATSGKAPKDLIDGLKAAENAAASATKELTNQQRKLADLDSQLTRTGINTKNLAAEQERLALASKAAADAAAVQAAKQQLGLTTLKDTETQAAKLRAAFDTLKASGTLSAQEVTLAQQRLNAELKALNDTVTKTSGGVKTLGADIKTAFTSVGGPALAAVGGIGAVTAGMAAAVAAAKEYRQTLAEASVGADLAKESASALGREAQDLASELGVNVNDALKGTFALLRAGIPEDNVIDVLRVATEAAKASLSDVGNGVKVAKLLLNDFKVAPADLGHAFDVLSKSVGGSKDGFETFAASAGPLLAVARSTGAGLEDVVQTLKAMQRGGIDAADSISDLTKFLTALSGDKARAALHDIGIDATSLTEIFTQLREKGARLQDVLDLTGISKKSAAAIAALINNGIKPLGDASDAVAKKNAKLYDTPREISDRFHATLEVTKIRLGEVAAGGGAVTIALTALLNVYNKLAAMKEVDAATSGTIQTLIRLAGQVYALKQAYDAQTTSNAKAARATSDYQKIEEDAAKTTEDHTAAIKAQQSVLETSAARLLESAKALEALTVAQAKAVEDSAQRQIQAIELAAGARRRASDEDLKAAENARVAAGVITLIRENEIVLIQKSADARAQEGISAKEAAAQILLVQQKAAVDELAILKDKVTKIQAAEEAGYAARTRAAGTNEIALRKAADEELADRQKTTQSILSLYQGLYDRLFKEARAGQDKVNAIDAERISFTEQITLKLRTIRQEGITGDVAYAQTIRDIDEATSKAKRALDEGDFKVGKQYTDQAITLAESLKGVTDDQGRVVVSNLEVQQQKIRSIKTAADQYSSALKEQGAAAKEGSDKAVDELDKIKPIIDDLNKKLSEIREKTADKLVLKMGVDENSIAQAQDIIRELVKPQTKVITIVTRKPGETAPSPAPDDTQESFPVPFAGGGPVPLWRDYVARYAAGGPVFTHPSWSKVPGSGDGDTVPALLQEGSFVVRKAASRYYGDAAMSGLARGYAGGGFIGGNTFDTKGAITQQAADLKSLFKDKITDPNQLNKLGQYFSSLPAGTQTQLLGDLQAGGTDALIAANQIEEGQATQARGAAKAIAPDDVSPPPSAKDAVNYARYVDSYLRFGNVFDLVKRQLGTFANQVQRSPNDAALIQAMVRTARAAASNAYLQDFHVGTGFGAQIPGRPVQLQDWYDFEAQHHPSKFAGGGNVDSVRAMLTPGEWVIPKNVAKMLGGGFLNAVNNMQAAPPAPRFFAAGGPVPGATIPTRGTATLGGPLIGELHLHTNGDIKDPRVRRELLRDLNDSIRRQGGKPLGTP